METYTDKAIDLIKLYGPKLAMAILTLIVGLIVIRIIVNAIGKLMKARNVDESLQPFLRSIAAMLLKVMLFISVIGMVGVEMTSFIAILGAAGLAVGMALSGTLQNFAGGVMLLIFKPFKVGDFVETQGYSGVVKEILIFNTILTTGDNKTIILANAAVSNGSIVNYSTLPTRRVDMTFGIGYNDDIDKARATMQRLIDADSRILKDPAPMIVVGELADSSVNFTVRTWVNSADYWGVFFDMHEQVKKTFDQENISIPYPQVEMHQN